MWHRAGALLARAAGLVHDIGKASERFAAKLRSEAQTSVDEVRHEWLSLKLLQALRRNGWDWPLAWAGLRTNLASVTLGTRVLGSQSPLSVSAANEAIDFLVVSHHGLLQCQSSGSGGRRSVGTFCPTGLGRHVRAEDPRDDQVTPVGEIAHEVLEAYRSAEEQLHALLGGESLSPMFWQGLSMVARAALISADHQVSRVVMLQPGADRALYANTAMFGPERGLNQLLDWHLREVGREAETTFSQMARWFGSTAGEAWCLPGIGASALARMSAPAPTGSRFQWQDVAATELMRARAQSSARACLVFNMAGTGTGKTRMNLRAACVLSREDAPRVSIALNLRSLTLQSGAALRESVGLSNEELSVVIGDSVSLDLFNAARATREYSDEDENPIEMGIDVEGGTSQLPEWLGRALPIQRDRALVATPVLVSTVDFLAAAGEPASQGRYVKALFRVCSADLVLDEVDSYEPEALVAVLRVVQLAAMAGRNVVCSSATLSQASAEAIHRAFRSGVAMRSALGGDQQDSYLCMAIDDLCSPGVLACRAEAPDFFSTWYQARTDGIAEAHRTSPVMRLARLQRLDEVSVDGWQRAVLDACRKLHAWNAWEYDAEGRRISFGLVRVANIATAVDMASCLSASLPHAHVACYHAGEFRIARFKKELRLDQLLSRTAGDAHIRADTEVQRLMRSASDSSVPFIVVATPVEEIGRDHDFDWAVIDPSSMQSVVQASGRVNRHRLKPCNGIPNICVMQFNWRHCRNEGDASRPAFCWPGYEDSTARPMRPSQSRPYLGHDLAELLPWSEDDLLVITSSLRFDPGCRLAAADDAAIRKRVAPYFGEEGAWVGRRPHSWLLTQGQGSPYALTPLRDKSGENEVWQITGSDYFPEFLRGARVSRNGRLLDAWLPEQMDTEAASPNAWLACGPEAMAFACEEYQISQAEGMATTMVRYSASDRFRYDLSFGISRVARSL